MLRILWLVPRLRSQYLPSSQDKPITRPRKSQREVQRITLKGLNFSHSNLHSFGSIRSCGCCRWLLFEFPFEYHKVCVHVFVSSQKKSLLQFTVHSQFVFIILCLHYSSHWQHASPSITDIVSRKTHPNKINKQSSLSLTHSHAAVYFIATEFVQHD